MNTKLKLCVKLWMMMGLLASGCNQSSLSAQMPDLGIPTDDMNTRFHLDAPAGWNTFKIGDIIAINVDVNSNDHIAFQYDYGARIFLLEDNTWVEVLNLINYPKGQVLLSKSDGDPFKQGSVGVVPDISNLQKAVKVRIVLIGNIYHDGQITNEQSAGYIDVELQP